MAKGNMFQGMARGKVGDVVFSRLNGQQISRVRNRSPKNPRTNAQLYQRAIMATIMAAYSAGKEIFDHAFENYAVGAGCQRRFMKLNTRALRSHLATEINTEAVLEEALAKTTAPGISTPIPNEYIISDGSYDQKAFSYRLLATENYGFILPAAETDGEDVVNETTKDYVQRVGLIPGDIYTIVFIMTDKNDVMFSTYGIESIDLNQVKRGAFGFVRLIAKDVSTDSALISTKTISDLFDIEAGGIGTANDVGNYGVTDGIEISMLATYGRETYGYSWGMIRSRRDVDLRSNSTMHVVNPAEFGLCYRDILPAWKKGTDDIGNSDLILEGGDEED